MNEKQPEDRPVCGVVYVASGEKFIREAETSLASLRATNPGLPVMLLTDQPVERPELWDKLEIDPHLMALTTTGRSCKAKLHMDRAPWDRCFYLDTDTLVVGDLSPAFALLDRFEFAADQIGGGHHYTIPGVPPSFPELSGGALLWRPTERVRKFFERWRELFDAYDQSDLGRTYDQKSLRVAMWESDVRYVRMPSNFNLMSYYPTAVEREVAVVHGRGFENLRSLEERMSHSTELRAYVPGLGALRHPQEMSWRECLVLVSRTLAWKIMGLFRPLIRRKAK
jgi:hypothetical protein